jgi:hypothetical protein
MWDEEEKRLLVSLPKTCYKVGKVQVTFSPVLGIRDDFCSDPDPTFRLVPDPGPVSNFTGIFFYC